MELLWYGESIKVMIVSQDSYDCTKRNALTVVHLKKQWDYQTSSIPIEQAVQVIHCAIEYYLGNGGCANI